MLLCVDVGNSNIVLGGYISGKLCFVSRVATNISMEADEYALLFKNILNLYAVTQKISNVAISCVVTQLYSVISNAFSHFMQKPPLFLNMGHAGALGVPICIDNPTELGTDILAAAIAVNCSCKLPAVIIDMGTATKLTAINAKGQLLGVAIMPGLYLSFNALVNKASALRGTPLQAPAAAIGKNTPESMKSGVIFGAADMLDGMISRFENEMCGLETVVATGGAAGLIIPHCWHKIEEQNTLVLEGLRIFSQKFLLEESHA